MTATSSGDGSSALITAEAEKPLMGGIAQDNRLGQMRLLAIEGFRYYDRFGAVPRGNLLQ